MKCYKGFNMFESKEEIINYITSNLGSRGIGLPNLIISSNNGETVLNTKISLEEINKLSFEEIDEKIRIVIDEYMS